MSDHSHKYGIMIRHLYSHMPDQPFKFNFPKCEFDKTKIAKRAFQAQRFGKWRWLHHDRSRDLVFCHMCYCCQWGSWDRQQAMWKIQLFILLASVTGRTQLSLLGVMRIAIRPTIKVKHHTGKLFSTFLSTLCLSYGCSQITSFTKVGKGFWPGPSGAGGRGNWGHTTSSLYRDHLLEWSNLYLVSNSRTRQ